jgi:hypothetical protein
MTAKVYLSVLFVSFGASIAGSEPLRVYIHDYAEVGEFVLHRTETEAARILRSAGIEPTWVNCPGSGERPQECHKSPDATELVIHLLPAGTTRRRLALNALGFAVPPEPGSFGSHGGVLYDRVERMSSRFLSTSVILGHAISHEIGHLLLGSGSHSGDGIMKSEWHYRELTRASQGTLVFSVDERREIQKNVRRRLAEMSAGLPRSVTSLTVGRTP